MTAQSLSQAIDVVGISKTEAINAKKQSKTQKTETYKINFTCCLIKANIFFACEKIQ